MDYRTRAASQPTISTPDQGTRSVAQDDRGGSGTCNGDPKSACYVTERGASFCGAGVGTGLTWDCVACERDRDRE